jgi:hypothetical protein
LGSGSKLPCILAVLRKDVNEEELDSWTKFIGFSASSAYLSVLCVKRQLKRREQQRCAENRREIGQFPSYLKNTLRQWSQKGTKLICAFCAFLWLVLVGIGGAPVGVDHDSGSQRSALDEVESGEREPVGEELLAGAQHERVNSEPVLVN